MRDMEFLESKLAKTFFPLLSLSNKRFSDIENFVISVRNYSSWAAAN